jgi:glutathione S-transferase
MSIIIQGVAASSYVRTARMICVEKQLPHTLETIDFGSAAHERAHPWKKVPIMVHGEVTLIETSAIARYLDEIGAGPSLLPATPAARAAMEQWISAINCYLYASLVKAYALPYIGAMRANREPDREAIAAAVPAMERDLARLDAAYAGKPHIVGDALSLADLFVAPLVATVAMFPEGKRALGGSKHLGRAFGAIAERESFGVAHAGLA